MVDLQLMVLSQLQSPRKGQTGENVGKTPNMFDGVDFERFPQTFTTLRDRFLYQPLSVFHIDPPLDLFHREGPISVSADDFLALVTPREWLSVPIIQIFMM